MPSIKSNLNLPSLDRKYWLFGITIALFQFAGYNAVTLALLAISLILLFSINEFFDNIQPNKRFMLFLVGSLLIGLIKTFFNDTGTRSLMMWGQFYFLAFALLGIKDKQQSLYVLKIVVFLIFFTDLFSNILLMLGFDLPWASLPPTRLGEVFPRFTGVKNNTLYSGSISFLAICMTLHNKHFTKQTRRILLCMTGVNLMLASSFRYYIILFAVVILIKFSLYAKKNLLKSTYMGIIIFVVLSTWLTRNISLSNHLRWRLWNYTIDRIIEVPLSGIGFMFQELKNNAMVSFHNLAMSGVTESTILLITLCFGIPMALLFLSTIYQTLLRMGIYKDYTIELGLFLSLSLDLFWGGSLDNSLSLSLFLLSLYHINHNGYIIQKVSKYIPDRIGRQTVSDDKVPNPNINSK